MAKHLFPHKEKPPQASPAGAGKFGDKYSGFLSDKILGWHPAKRLFFSIAFYATGIPWVTLAFGDLAVKLFIALAMLIPFRLLIYKIKDFSESSVSEIKN